MHGCMATGCTQELVASRLGQAGWEIKYIQHVENKNKRKLEDRPWFNTTFSKLHVFGLTEYDKIVYLDADVLLLANVDELFDKLPLPPAEDSVAREELDRRPFAAASEVFPPDTFNSGLRSQPNSTCASAHPQPPLPCYQPTHTRMRAHTHIFTLPRQFP